MSEALIFASDKDLSVGTSLSDPDTILGNDDRLSFELQEQYMKNASSEHVLYTFFLFWHLEEFMYTMCSELAISLYWTCNSMNNLLSYCELVDARISASTKIYL